MIDEFLKLLKESPKVEVFNPWWEVDFEHDQHNDSYKVRQQNLRTYFSERLGQVQYIMLAEALGYQGGHFTGIPMTSERLLLGELADKALNNLRILQNLFGMSCHFESIFTLRIATRID